MQRGGGLGVHSDDRTVQQNLAAANELRQTRAHPGPNHREHWDVGQTPHMLHILSAWVDASWGGDLSNYWSPPESQRWVGNGDVNSFFKKEERLQIPKMGQPFSPVSPEGAMGGFSNGMVLENEQRNTVAYEAWTQVR